MKRHGPWDGPADIAFTGASDANDILTETDLYDPVAGTFSTGAAMPAVRENNSATLLGNGKVLEDGTVRKLDVKIGDRVLFGKYSGTEVKLEGEERLIVREDDILAVLEK